MDLDVSVVVGESKSIAPELRGGLYTLLSTFEKSALRCWIQIWGVQETGIPTNPSKGIAIKNPWTSSIKKPQAHSSAPTEKQSEHLLSSCFFSFFSGSSQSQPVLRDKGMRNLESTPHHAKRKRQTTEHSYWNTYYTLWDNPVKNGRTSRSSAVRVLLSRTGCKVKTDNLIP